MKILKRVLCKCFRITHLSVIYIRFLIRRYVLGLEYAYRLFETMDRSAIIPMLRSCGAKIGNNCTIESPLRLHMVGNSLENLLVGDNVSISKGVLIDVCEQIEIRNNTTIAMDVSLVSHEHYGHVDIRGKSNNKSKPTTIGSNVYIGTRTVVLCGVVINNNVIIGANSLVNKSVHDPGVYVGSPARRIKEL